MALLYPWATKEYLLWEMSLGQIILYHNLGIEMRYGKPDGSKGKFAGMSQSERRKAREEARRQLQLQGLRPTPEAQAQSDAKKAQYRDKYGDV